jgi:tetratricopeptide (TPR) repeat protein
MDRKVIVGFSTLALLTAACGQMDFGGEKKADKTSVTNLVKSGRIALLYDKPDEALPYFRRAAEADPSYVNDFTPLKEGVWTYVARAYYDSRKFPEAEQPLKEALQRNKNDFMARLYLGLTTIQRQTKPKPITPLSLEQILTLLRSSVSTSQVATFVRERGTNFSVNQENEKELRQAGANDALVDQLKRQPRVTTEERPSQEGLRNVEIALQEMRAWLDQMSQTPEGKSWDPQRQIRTQIDKTLRGINSLGKQQVINAGESIGRTLEEETDLAQARATAN